MKRLTFFISIAFLLFFASCKVTRSISTSHTASTQLSDTNIRNDKDSTFYSKIQTIHDTLFRIKSDSASIQALIQCDKKGEAFLKQIIQLKTGRKISQSIHLKDNILTVRAKIDSAAIYFQYRDTHIKEGRSQRVSEKNKHSEKTQITNVSKTKKTVTKWPIWLYLLIAGAAGWLFYKYLLPIFSPWLKIFLNKLL